MKKSFYGHILDEKTTGESIFIKEDNTYFRATLYPIDQEEFNANYELEGLFLESLQLPPRPSYKKKFLKNTQPEKIKKNHKKDKSSNPLLSNPLLVKNKSLPEKKTAAIIFKLVSSQLLSDGSHIHFWAGKNGALVKVYDSFEAFKKHER